MAAISLAQDPFAFNHHHQTSYNNNSPLSTDSGHSSSLTLVSPSTSTDSFKQHHKLNYQEQQQQHVYCQGKQFGLSLRDFKVICTLGTGTFGKVLLVRLLDRPHPSKQDRYYAIKVLAKTQVVRLKQIEHVNSEKDLLATVSSKSTLSRFYVSLLCTFQDHLNLYLLQEFVEGGELFSHLRRAGKFSADTSKFYASNVVLAFEGLHSLDIIYRDLKPENLLLSMNGYLKLTDFGFAKNARNNPIQRAWKSGRLVGIWYPDIRDASRSSSVFNPDCSAGPFEIYEKILAAQLHFPPTGNFDHHSIDLISRLLTVDCSKRIGNLKAGIQDIKNHPWFRGVDWDLLSKQIIPAPILPKLSNPGDPSNFDRYPNVELSDLPGFNQPIHHHRHLQTPYFHHHHPSPYSPIIDEDPYRHLFESF
ncbi:hypothetical protein KEM48_008985 [Puccinia striiformis f. sp. tritici PST-130]|nr:hypothetical protein KEM48_008985 [Puccinia striiformis f. sp. tritici PST-130]